MLKTKKHLWFTVLSGLSLLAAVVGLWLFGRTQTVNAAESLRTITQAETKPGLLENGYLTPDGPGFGRGIDYAKLLADALGITVEELEAAHQTARDAALDLAVAQGLIPQERADELKVWGGGRSRPDRGRRDVANADAIDEAALLADALGITVEQLQAARETANQAAIAQAVAEGLITQEEADAMQARKDVKRYLERDALLATALGMTTEALQAAYAEGQTLTDLLAEKGLDAATVRENLQAAHAAALAQAVADGVITQEQADEMQLDGRGFGFMPGGPMQPGGRMRPGGRDGGRGRGDAPCPPAPDAAPDDPTGSGWRAPNHTTIQPGNDA